MLVCAPRRTIHVELLSQILSIVGTALIVWALILLLQASDWNRDHFRLALRANPRVLALGLFGLGLEAAGLLLLLVP